MSTSRRGFLKLLTAAIATPVIAKLSMDESLALPAKIEVVETIEPAIVRSGAASFARANRIYCMPGMIGHLSDHVRSAAMGSLPGGTHFQIRSVRMSSDDMRQAGVKRGPVGVALVWVSESDVTPNDSEFELVGRFMVPKREELVVVPAEPNSIAARLAKGESLAEIDADVRAKWVLLDGVKEPEAKRPDFWERLLGVKR